MPLDFEMDAANIILTQSHELIDQKAEQNKDLNKCVFLLGRFEHHHLMNWLYYNQGRCTTLHQEFDYKTEEWIWYLIGIKAIFNMRVESQLILQELDHES